MPPPLAALLTAVLAGLVLRFRRHLGFVPEDVPGGRKRHARPIPLLGAIPATAAIVAIACALEPPFAVAIAIATAVGAVDDTRKARGGGSRWTQKLLPLLIAAAIAAHAIHPWHERPWCAALAFAFVFVVVNAVNFLDNTDGVGSVVAGLGLVLAATHEPAFAIAGYAALGFLAVNWPWPRAFLGDAGAYGLGCALALAALAAATAGGTTDWRIAAAPVALPLLDFCQVVAMRIWIGRPPWIGDRRHLTHIVQNVGVPRALVAPLAAVCVVVSFAVLRD